MSLRDQVRAGAATALLAVRDLLDDIEYHHVTIGAYDNATDTKALTETVRTIKGLFYKSKDEERDWQRSDLIESKVLIGATDLPGITPAVTDYMIIAGIKYEIVRQNKVPTDPIYLFVVRAV